MVDLCGFYAVLAALVLCVGIHFVVFAFSAHYLPPRVPSPALLPTPLTALLPLTDVLPPRRA